MHKKEREVEKGTPVKPRNRRRNNIKLDFRERGSDYVDWMLPGSDEGTAENMAMNRRVCVCGGGGWFPSVPSREFQDSTSDYRRPLPATSRSHTKTKLTGAIHKYSARTAQ